MRILDRSDILLVNMKISTRLRKFFLIILIGNFFRLSVSGQLYINEFMASNATVITDPDYDEYADWIEIYNAGDATVNLKGYYITDNLGNPDKWQITSNVTIGAHGFLIIWADEKNNGKHTSFKLAQEGEEIGLFSPELSLIDSLRYIYQTTDISYGRNPDGAENWAYYLTATPGSANNTTAYIDRVENIPEFSVLGGLFVSPLEVELSTLLGGTIRYTSNGTEPSITSLDYISPIPVNSTTIIRARIFKPGMIPGKVVTHSYFIDESLEERKLPVISIATDPDNFWDPESGIYVQDFKPEWEVPINIELFENDGSDRAALNELAGTKINGLYSWQLPQKMLGIYFRKQYGNNSIEYPLIPDKHRTRYKSFVLRASGSDWSYTLFRDGMIQNSTRPNMNVGIMGFQPSIVFVNGEYMGIHNIREKVDDNYIEENYSMTEGSFDLIENEDTPSAGDLNAYNELLNLLSQDLSIQANYDAVANKMDIKDFTDYVITEIFSQNTSVDHNVMAWKPKDAGKWRWILMDLDRGFFHPENNLINYYVSRDVIPLQELLENSGYKAYFGKRLADHLYTTFNPLNIHKLINKHQYWIENEMPYHIERWLGTTSSYGDAMPSIEYWYEQVSVLHDFADARPQILLDDLQSYGFNSSATLTLGIFPSNGAYLLFNGIAIPEPAWTGSYPQNLQIQLTAVDKPGYDFIGWAQSTSQVIIPTGSVWKYLDNGSNQGTAWKEEDYNDAGWAEGPAELGYGDGDEQTIISYGGDSYNKYITTYFRHYFNLTGIELSASQFTINLLRDDGAIVYINGQEVIRSNMGSGLVNYESLAINSISGSSESEFISYSIDGSVFKEGENIIATEVHQNSPSSSDVSFNLELVCYLPNTSSFVSTNRNFQLSLTEDYFLTAVYEENGQCILPETIESDLILNKDCSPYVGQGDITITPGATLTIEPGVQLFMAKNSNLFVNGEIEAIGTAAEGISFLINPEYTGEKWGALCFHNTEEPSHLSYVTIKGASRGPDPSHDVAAISAFYADLVLDHVIIENVFHNPVAARYSDITLTNSRLHSNVTGDLINVKYGSARIENTEFRGNNQPDTDGIDYDGIDEGIIRNCAIYDFYGFSSDAIDIGEQARNISIDSLFICNITDKGISVGQRSTANINNCIIVNCNLGLGLKDSCRVEIDQCTFYGTNIPVSCFEKNPGRAGGNAIVKNSIFSNSYDYSFYSDHHSTLQINNSIADYDSLPDLHQNLYGNPLFEEPSFSNFQLQANSPCILAGNQNGEPIDMGSVYYGITGNSSVMFSLIFNNPLNDPERSEFICISNPSTENIDLYGYAFIDGIEYTFSDHVILEPGKRVFLVKDINNPHANHYYGQVFEWTSGSLANEGEKLRLIHPSGIVIDQVSYSPDSPWPNTTGNGKEVLSLIDAGMDNHFGTSWTAISYTSALPSVEHQNELSFTVYPNPSYGNITISAIGKPNSEISIYTLTGEFVLSGKLDNHGQAHIDLSGFNAGILLLKVDNLVQKIIIIDK